MAKKDFIVVFKEIIKEQKRKGDKIMAMAMNMTAKQVKEELIDEMKKVFDNPTPWTLNSLYVIPAKPDKLIVAIKIKDFAGKGTPASEYLSAQIEGGTRAQKKSEKQLTRNVVGFNSNNYIMPGKGLKLNKYGNVTSGKMTQILSAISAFTETGFNANKTKDSIKKNPNQDKYFVITKAMGSHLMPGVYYRVGKGGKKLRPILIFTDAPPHYNKRFEYFELASKYYQSKIQANTDKATAIVYGKGTP